MELSTAREQVIAMGLRLLETGLTARTWGNISCRLDDNHFVITPSGKAYTDLTAEDIVIVNIRDGRSWGSVRPSSEKGVHQVIYQRRPEVGFIIHSHQNEASALSALESDIGTDLVGNVFGDAVACAAYGFPGSETLQSNVEEVLARSRGQVMLLAHHGAVCFGNDAESTLRLAAGLEVMASFAIRRGFERYMERPMTIEDSPYEVILESYGKKSPKKTVVLYRSERRGARIDFYIEDKQETVLINQKKLSPVQKVHKAIYDARPDIEVITHTLTPSVLTYSMLHRSLEAYLDDFAQINGATMDCALLEPEDIAAKLGAHHGVLLADNGALCCGKNFGDADALALIAEKNARARLIAEFFPDLPLKPLDSADTEKMRRFYLESYSKRY